MPSPSFAEKLAALQTSTQSDLGLWIAPQIEKFPLPIQRFDEPFLPFGKAIINATCDLVCAYIFDFPSYLYFGAAGMIALERTIDYVGSEHISILHGGFSLPGYARLTDENSFGADALTVAKDTLLEAFTVRHDRGVFVMQPPIIHHNEVEVGEYDLQQNVLRISTLQIRLLDKDLIYASRLDDFTDVVRSRVEQFRHG